MSNNQPTQAPQTNPQENQQHKENNQIDEIQQEINRPQNQIQMELQNQGNQVQNQQDPVNNEDHEEGEQGQIQEQEIPSERQQLVQNIPQPNINALISINKDSYINKLETYLNKVRSQLQNKSKQFQELLEDNKKTKQNLKKVRFQFLSSKQQISTLTQQQLNTQKQNENLQKLNQQLSEQIETYREAGDINFYKNKITELEKLLEVQKKELRMKQAMIDQKDELQSTLSNTSKSKIQILSLIQKYENQNRQLAKRHAEVCLINTDLQTAKQKLQLDLQELKIKVSQTQQTLALEKQKIMQLEEHIKVNEEDFQRKLKLSEETKAQLISNQDRSQMKQGNGHVIQNKLIKSPSEQYGIKILTPVEERNIIMREFIELQIKYQSVIEELSSLRQRHFNTLRQIKNISTNHVPKKDYSQLYKKYSKLRKCLENSLINEENIRKELLRYTTVNNASVHNSENKDINLSQNEQARNAFSRYKSLLLEQPENAINKIDKIIQKPSDSQKQLFTLKQQLQTKQRLIKTDKSVKQKEEKIQNLQRQIEKLKNLLQLYDTQLTYKNNQIQLLRKNNRESIQRIYELQRNYISKQEQHKLTAQLEEKKILIEILEIKNIQALKENCILKNQKQILTQLYSNLKNMYEEILNRQPQLQAFENKPKQQRQKDIVQLQNQPCKQCIERQEKQKQIKFMEIQCQTEGLTELYFKQIKELLTILRKFPKKVETVTGILEADKSTIHQVKKRYDQAIESYKTNSRQLQEERKGNDQWRLKQKDQIRQEFQQIRQLLLNERLITALRKAKSLIEFYEQNAPEAEGEENMEEGEQQEGIEKNQENIDEPIEQQKQNS